MEEFEKIFDNTAHAFVIAEIGSNWKVGSYEDDLEQATKLIQKASMAGADAVKFQTFRAESVYVPNAGNAKHLAQSGLSINEIFKKNSMPYEMIPELVNICKLNNIRFMSSAFSVSDVNEIEPFVICHKVASYEINHIRLLEAIAKSKKPILISTGASTYDEIDFAVNLLKENNGGPIVLLQCTSKYPCPIEALNLLVIPKLKKRYGVPIGFSDHSVEPIVGPILALGLGATVIEKHFTLDKKLTGPDHLFSLNPDELRLMIKSIRLAENAKGDGLKRILNEEDDLKKFAKRSIQAIKNISKGDIFEEGINIDVLRPGSRTRGAESRFLFQIIGKKSSKNIKKDEGVTLNDYM